MGAVAGALGGVCWIAAHVAHRAGSGAGLVDGLTWAGVALLTIAVVVAGASLVSSSAAWLRVVVAVCFAALVGSVLQILREGGDALLVDAVFGAAVLVVTIVVLARGRRRPGPAAAVPTPAPARAAHAAEPGARRSRGSHAR